MVSLLPVCLFCPTTLAEVPEKVKPDSMVVVSYLFMLSTFWREVLSAEGSRLYNTVGWIMMIV